MFFVFMNAPDRMSYIIPAMIVALAINIDEGRVVAAPKTALPVFGKTLQVGNVIIKKLETIGLPVKQIQAAFIGSTGPQPVLRILVKHPHIIFFLAGDRVITIVAGKSAGSFI